MSESTDTNSSARPAYVFRSEARPKALCDMLRAVVAEQVDAPDRPEHWEAPSGKGLWSMARAGEFDDEFGIEHI